MRVGSTLLILGIKLKSFRLGSNHFTPEPYHRPHTLFYTTYYYYYQVLRQGLTM